MMVAQHTNDPPTEEMDGEENSPDDWQIEEIPDGLIDNALEFIFAEHQRQREASAILLKVAEGAFNHQGIVRLTEFFKIDLALHICDEEEVLFPLLRKHCTKEDDVDAIIDRLVKEHLGDITGRGDVITILTDLLAGKPLDDSAKQRLSSFSEHVRQHLALENATLLPIARVRLGTKELRLLSKLMKQRRATHQT